MEKDTLTENIQFRGRNSRLSPLSHCGETLSLRNGSNWCARADVHYEHLAQAVRKSPEAMEKRRKPQVLDGTGSRSLNSACRRLSCIGRLSVDLRQQQHSAALWTTQQPSSGRALLAPHGSGPRKGGLNKACLTLTWLASRGKTGISSKR